MFEHMMFRGTDRLGPTDHFSLIRRVGGTTNGYTGFDRTVYLETLPADQLELALWLEAERMTFLKIDQEAFDTERKVVEEERRVGCSRPYGTFFEKLMAEVYKLHPYRWTPIGNIPHLRAAAVQELRRFWQKYYVPNNATLIIVGAVSHAEAQKLAKKYFGWIPKYAEPPGVTVREPKAAGARSVTIKEDNAPAPKVEVIWRTVPVRDNDSIVLGLMSNILGEGNSSRLYRELVAEKQLAVQAFSWSWSLEQDGLFGGGALLAPTGGDVDKVIRIIEEHIERLRTGLVSERELTKAKNQMLRQQVTANLRISSKATMLGRAAVEIGDVSRVNRYLEDIRKVTAEDIRRAAKEYLTQDGVLRVKVEQAEEKGSAEEEDAPVTAEREEKAPKAGREGLVRAADFPKSAPMAKFSPAKLTPNHSSYVLDNGLKVMVVPNREVPFVSIQLGFLSGAWTEDKAGTASMAMKMLTKGTKNYSEGELADELETYAISLSGIGQMDTAMVKAGALSEQVGRVMELLGEVVLSPTFPIEEFEKLRRQVLTSLAVSSAEPSYIANKHLRRVLYGEHPYSRTAVGEVADVNGLKVEDLERWWAGFVRPEGAVLIFAGDIEPEKALELAKETFGAWQGRGNRPEVNLAPIKAPASRHIYLVDRPGSIQSQIRIAGKGIIRHDDGYFVSRVVSNYFGWGFDSRLNESVRVQKGLTYSVWGGFIASRFAGEFTMGTFTKTASTADAVSAVLEEVGRLKAEAPSEKELENSKTYLLGSFVRGRETPQQTADDLWLIESQKLGADYLERLLAGIAEANEEDCRKLVARTVEPERLVIVVLGDAARVKEALGLIAPVTVVEDE
jgi:zinc protease